MTELVTYSPQTDLQVQMEYARAVSSGSLLPQAYRDNPANVLIAVGLGAAMGLSPAESLYRIDVIAGKPCAAAELIASNVRKSGHKLRVRVTENPPYASCTITRADDPDEPVTIERDMAWAQRMGLANKDNYKKQPATMLSWRAISACARLVCSEALYGVAYTPDEMGDMDDQPRYTATVTQPANGADRMRAIIPQAMPTLDEPEAVVDVTDLEEAPDPVTPEQVKKIHVLLGKVGMGGEANRDRKLRAYAVITGREVTSTKDLTKHEAHQIIDSLEQREQTPEPAYDETGTFPIDTEEQQ